MGKVPTPDRAVFITPSEMFTEVPKKLSDAYGRRCFRVLRMVSILHGKGFHGLRVLPYLYPLAYRIELYPAAFTCQDGVKYRFEEELDRGALVARYSGADGAKFFGWEDAESLSAHELALLFIERYPKLANAAFHFDFAYVGWFSTLLAHCEYGHLPYRFSEYEEDLGVMRIHHVGDGTTAYQMDWFPLPPSASAGVALDPRPVPRWMEAE